MDSNTDFALGSLAASINLLALEVRRHGELTLRAALAGAALPLNPRAPKGAKNPDAWSFGAKLAALVSDCEEGFAWSDNKREAHANAEKGENSAGTPFAATDKEQNDAPF
jgi:hypothetical protein